MKNSKIFIKIIVVFIALIIYLVFLFNAEDSKHETPQQATIDQRDITKSKQDSLNTARANILLSEKESVIRVLKSMIAKEKVKTATHKAEARKLHVLNDTLQARFVKDKDLSTCEDLVEGLKFEIVEKDSVIESLDSQVEIYSSKMNELEDKIDIQEGIIDSKQDLIANKDSTIAYYKAQKKKANFWYKGKIIVAGAILLIETIGLVLK